MKNKITINIGESYASMDPAVIYTLLGSCVAVCLYDPEARIGGMNHILLPGKLDIHRFDTSARYGVNAMDILIGSIIKLGGSRRRLVAKAFGGANILPGAVGEYSIGQKLVQFVMEFLETEKIRLINRDFGGDDIRKIFFHTDTGEAFLRRIRRVDYPSLFAEELKKLKRIQKQIAEAGETIIFKSGRDLSKKTSAG